MAITLEQKEASPQFEDLTGRRFGTLTVTGIKEIKSTGTIVWNCVCDCSAHSYFSGWRFLCTDDYKRAYCRFCKDTGIHIGTRDERRVMYSTWTAMKDRCFNEKNHAFKNYGGRGIYVCEEWKNDFTSFYKYVRSLEHYNEGRTLDRINNDDGYRPGNVRWATRQEQMRNRRKRNAGNKYEKKELEPRSNQEKASI